MPRTLASYAGLPGLGGRDELREINVEQLAILRLLYQQAGSFVDGPMDYIVKKVLQNGFSVKMFSGGGSGVDVISKELDARQYSEWLIAVGQILRHAMLYGFAVLHYVTSADGQRLLPRVLDPVTECWVRFTSEPTEQRRFFAFSRAEQRLTMEPMRNTRVLMFTEPDSDGMPSSPLSKVQIVLGYLVRMLSRSEHRDIRRTNPPLLFQTGVSGTNAFSATINAKTANEVITEPEFNLLLGARGTTVFEERTDSSTENQHLLQLVRQQEMYDELLGRQFQSTRDYGTDQLHFRRFDPMLRSYVVSEQPNPFRPAKMLPTGVQLAPHIPAPSTGPEFGLQLEAFQDQIALAFGVPANFFRIPAQYTATHVELMQDTASNTIETYQRLLELFFVDIFFDLYAAGFEKRLADDVKKSKEPPPPANEPDEESENEPDEENEPEEEEESEKLLAQLKAKFSFEAVFPRNIWYTFADLSAMYQAGILPFEDYARVALQNSNIEITGKIKEPQPASEPEKKKQSASKRAKPSPDNE
jgi:hypothetical protein